MIYNYIFLLFIFIFILIYINYKKQQIFIIYYAFINSNNYWKDIIIGQLEDMKNSGILNSNYFYNVNLEIVLSGDFIDLIDATIEIEKYLKEISFNKYKITTVTENLYEYPGILQLYTKGKENQNGIFLYLHSKGMSFHKNNGRIINEVKLTRHILFPWKKIISIFNNNQYINKITIANSENGWGWFNFFWVRGSYLQNCKEPIISDIRHYYESWLGFNGSNTYKDCYNLINPYKDYYTPYEAEILLENLDIIDKN